MVWIAIAGGLPALGYDGSVFRHALRLRAQEAAARR